VRLLKKVNFLQRDVFLIVEFSADRTNGHPSPLMIQCCVRLSSVCLSVVCNVCIVAKRCVLPKMSEE